MDREHQYDLLTAALLGAALGAAATLLIGTGVSRRQPRSPVRRALRQGGKWASTRSAAIGGALRPDALRGQMGDVLSSARESIADVVDSELRDLRKKLRRERRRIGL